MKYDYDGSGIEREIACSAYTVMIYEQQFKVGLVEDVYGKVRVSNDRMDENGNIIVANFSTTNWGAYIKALWAMLRTGEELARAEHREYEHIPVFDTWAITATHLDIAEIFTIVNTRIQEDLFRTGTSAAEGDAGTD